MDKVLAALGKGPGFVAFAFLQVVVSAVLLKMGISGTEIALAFTPIDTALYGGGMFKLYADNKKVT